VNAAQPTAFPSVSRDPAQDATSTPADVAVRSNRDVEPPSGWHGADLRRSRSFAVNFPRLCVWKLLIGHP